MGYARVLGDMNTNLMTENATVNPRMAADSILILPPGRATEALTPSPSSVTNIGARKKTTATTTMPPKAEKPEKPAVSKTNGENLPADGVKLTATRQRDLDAAISSITKAYGEGSIMRLGQGHAVKIEVIPTGALSLDLALGVGGIPRGRVVEIFGPESSGKTTVSFTATGLSFTGVTVMITHAVSHNTGNPGSQAM